MKTADEAEALLSRLTRGEKARLLQRVAQDLGDAYPGVDVIDEVCGGEPVIVRTRIPVWLLERYRQCPPPIPAGARHSSVRTLGSAPGD